MRVGVENVLKTINKGTTKNLLDNLSPNEEVLSLSLSKNDQ